MVVALTVAIAILQLLDWWTTHRILSKGGIEKNPVAVWFMCHLTVDGFLGIKAVAVTAACWYIATVEPIIAAMLVAWYIAVIAYNLKSIKGN